MSLLVIRCPFCGSAAAETTTANEYECSHCKSKFQVVRPADATVVTDAKTHHCPICGRAVQTLQSFKCTECGKVDFCERCVASLPTYGTERFVCRACVSQKGWACQSCGSYAITVCVNCRRRTCREHVSEMFGLMRVGRDGSIVAYFNCPNCHGQLCSACVQLKKKILSTKYLCGKCGGELELETEPSSICKFCGHSVDPVSTFCASCGRALS